MSTKTAKSRMELCYESYSLGYTDIGKEQENFPWDSLVSNNQPH